MVDPEAKSAERIARQGREAHERAEAERNQVSVVLLVVGVLLMAVGVWFLLVTPGQSTYGGGEALINLHRLALGETAAIAGVIMFAAGAIIRYR